MQLLFPRVILSDAWVKLAIKTQKTKSCYWNMMCPMPPSPKLSLIAFPNYLGLSLMRSVPSLSLLSPLESLFLHAETFTSQDLKNRVDLRHLDICSVDPPGCTDIDDALHCIPLSNGNFEVTSLLPDCTFQPILDLLPFILDLLPSRLASISLTFPTSSVREQCSTVKLPTVEQRFISLTRFDSTSLLSRLLNTEAELFLVSFLRESTWFLICSAPICVH